MLKALHYKRNRTSISPQQLFGWAEDSKDYLSTFLRDNIKHIWGTGKKELRKAYIAEILATSATDSVKSVHCIGPCSKWCI
jgi:hypothetical protein